MTLIIYLIVFCQIITLDSVHVLRNTQVHQNTNNYGKSIIELCSDSQLRILNRRTLGDSVGKATYFNYSGVTINDYCICSASFLKKYY